MWRIRRMSIFCFYLGVYLHIVNPISTIYCTNPTCQSAGPVQCTSRLTQFYSSAIPYTPTFVYLSVGALIIFAKNIYPCPSCPCFIVPVSYQPSNCWHYCHYWCCRNCQIRWPFAVLGKLQEELRKTPPFGRKKSQAPRPYSAARCLIWAKCVCLKIRPRKAHVLPSVSDWNCNFEV